MPAGEGVVYSMAKLGGRSAAAISPQQADEAAQGVPPHWNVYVTVDGRRRDRAARSARPAAQLLARALRRLRRRAAWR